MSEVKECFVSRFKDGVIMEADFSQLEVIGQAIVTGDKQLKQDLLDGLDMHCLNAEFLYGVTYETIHAGVKAGVKKYIDMRQNAKEPSFLRQYGGGPKLLSERTGLPYSQCKTFIEKYYSRYPQVKEHQEEVERQVNASKRPSKRKSPSGKPLMVGYYKSITGRRYVFYQYENTKPGPHMGECSFSPTEMKNYPIQGFATGDIVPEVLGRLYREIKSNKLDTHVKLINTIHDSIMLDVHPSAISRARDILEYSMRNADKWMKFRFGIDIDIPFKVDVKYASSWYNCKQH